MRRCVLLLVCLCAAAARADQNDLQLWKLGHPDALGCTACAGQPGDTAEPGDPRAQGRFHRLASTLGLALSPPFGETAGTLGQSGFEVSVSSAQAFLRIPSDAWPTSSGVPPGVLIMPAVTLRKGLGASLELGAAVSFLLQSQMMALSAELRWALVDGLLDAPDVALRAFGTRVVGAQDLGLTMAGADAQVSKSFGVAGTLKLQPYLQAGLELIDARSSVIDFKPSAEDPANPSADDGLFHTISLFDNRYYRAALGMRLLAGAVVLGAEASTAWGTNAVQSDRLASGAAPPTNFVRLWSGSVKLGFGF